MFSILFAVFLSHQRCRRAKPGFRRNQTLAVPVYPLASQYRGGNNIINRGLSAGACTPSVKSGVFQKTRP